MLAFFDNLQMNCEDFEVGNTVVFGEAEAVPPMVRFRITQRQESSTLVGMVWYRGYANGNENLQLDGLFSLYDKATFICPPRNIPTSQVIQVVRGQLVLRDGRLGLTKQALTR